MKGYLQIILQDFMKNNNTRNIRRLVEKVICPISLAENSFL